MEDVIELLGGPPLAGQDKAKRMLARIHIDAKNHEAAAPLVDDLFATSPDHPKLVGWKSFCDSRRLAERMQEGEALLSADRLEDAEGIFGEFLSSGSPSWRVHFRLGQIHSLQQRWTEAVQELRSGLAIDPSNIKIRKSLANALLKAGVPAEAYSVLGGGRGGESDLKTFFAVAER